MEVCGKCGKETDKLVPYTWKKWGTDELVHPEGVCVNCDEEQKRETQAGIDALFGGEEEESA